MSDNRFLLSLPFNSTTNLNIANCALIDQDGVIINESAAIWKLGVVGGLNPVTSQAVYIGTDRYLATYNGWTDSYSIKLKEQRVLHNSLEYNLIIGNYIAGLKSEPLNINISLIRGKGFRFKDSLEFDYIRCYYNTSTNTTTASATNVVVMGSLTSTNLMTIQRVNDYEIKLILPNIRTSLNSAFSSADYKNILIRIYKEGNYCTFDNFIEPEISGYHLLNNDGNIDVSPSKDTFNDGEVVEITITPKSGYFYPSSAPYLTNSTETVLMVKDGESYKATITFNSDWTIISNAKEYVTLTYTCNNCYCNYANGSRFEKGGAFPNDIYIYPNDKFYFPKSETYDYIVDGITHTLNFYIYTDRKEQHISPPETTINGNIEFNVEALYFIEKLGFISIYNPTSQEIINLAKKRFFNWGQESFVDYSQYIISLKKLYIIIPSTIKQTVYYGEFDTQIECNLIDTDNIEIQCGDVRINEYFNNRLDYDNTKLELYLPFIGIVELEPSKYMGKRVALKYNINPISGDCVATVYLYGYAQSPFMDTFAGNISFEVPIFGGYREGTLQRNSYADTPLYLVKETTPYVNIIRDIPLTINGESLSDHSIGFIHSYSGLCTFTDIQLEMTNGMTNVEYNEIISLLESGVNI